jgi:hypothetical protein
MENGGMHIMPSKYKGIKKLEAEIVLRTLPKEMEKKRREP